MWSTIISLVKTNRYLFEFHSSPIWNEYHLWSSALSCCGWLASSFDQCLHESTIWNTTWNIMTSSLLGVACFSWSILCFLQLSISNVSRITTSMLAFQVPHLVHLHIGGKPLHLGRSDISPRTILDTHLKWLDWLIQVMDLTWWVTLIPSLSPFLSTCLSPFLSVKWFSNHI